MRQGVDQPVDAQTVRGNGAGNRIDQKRHVVVGDVEHRHARYGRVRCKPYLGGAGTTRREKRPGIGGDGGELFRTEAREIVGHCAAEQFGRKFGRHRIGGRRGIGVRRAFGALVDAGIELDRHL